MGREGLVRGRGVEGGGGSDLTTAQYYGEQQPQ